MCFFGLRLRGYRGRGISYRKPAAEDEDEDEDEEYCSQVGCWDLLLKMTRI